MTKFDLEDIVEEKGIDSLRALKNEGSIRIKCRKSAIII